MKFTISPLLLTLFLFGCDLNRQEGFAVTKVTNRITVDTLVGSKTITNEIAGSAYRKRAVGYFVIINNDTSDYTCIFTESKENGKVGMDLNIRNPKVTMTYRQRLQELKIILPKAITDFDFDSLTSISFGRLILSGDLAIDITKQYCEKFGTSNQLESYTTVGNFLKESRLGTDFNNLFQPYSITVDKVSIEKLFFTSPKSLFGATIIETDTTEIPDKILDCITWATLKKK